MFESNKMATIPEPVQAWPKHPSTDDNESNFTELCSYNVRIEKLFAYNQLTCGTLIIWSSLTIAIYEELFYIGCIGPGFLILGSGIISKLALRRDEDWHVNLRYFILIACGFCSSGLGVVAIVALRTCDFVILTFNIVLLTTSALSLCACVQRICCGGFELNCDFLDEDDELFGNFEDVLENRTESRTCDMSANSSTLGFIEPRPTKNRLSDNLIVSDNPQSTEENKTSK